MRITALMQIRDTDARKEGHVTLLQLFLVQHFKLDASKYITGVFDVKTQELVKRIQRSAGLPPMGNFGPKTREYVRGLCMQHNPSLGGRAEVPQQKTKKALQVLAEQNGVSAEEIQSVFKKVIGVGAAMGAFVAYYESHRTLPVYTTPTPLKVVLPYVVQEQMKVNPEAAKNLSDPKKLEEAIAQLQEYIGNSVYLSDSAGKNMCIGMTVDIPESRRKTYTERIEKMKCTLVSSLASHNVLIGMNSAELDALLVEANIRKEKAKQMVATQDIRSIQVALELYFDTNGSYPVYTSPVPASSVIGTLKEFFTSSRTLDAQYVTDASGKKYCMGMATATPPSGAQASCTNGLSLPPGLNYVVQQ
jgi:hypothetical protein